MSKKINYSELIKETLILTIAVAIIAAAVFFFLVPSHASVSSISGLGIVLSNFIPMPLSAITMILNFSPAEKNLESKQFIRALCFRCFLDFLNLFFLKIPQ